MLNRIKIKFHGIHYCYLNEQLCIEFLKRTEYADLKTWIKDITVEYFLIPPDSKKNIAMIQSRLKELYYDSPGEWLQEQMRIQLKTR